MSLIKNDKFVDRAIDRLQQKDREQLAQRNLIECLVSEIQEVEDAMYEVYTEFGVYTAIGAQLDIIGSLVGELRSGRSDTAYRTAILARIQLNVGAGEPNTIINAVKQWMNPMRIDFSEPAPAYFTIFIQSAVNIPNIATIIGEIAPAGVGSSVTTLPSNLNPLFLAEVKGEPADFVIKTNTVDNYSIDGADTLVVEAMGSVGFSSKAILAEVYLTKYTFSINDGLGFDDYDIGDGDLLDVKLNNSTEDYTVSIFGGKLSEVRV